MSNATMTSKWDDADLDTAPPVTQEDLARAVHRVGLQPAPGKKTKISIALDPDVVSWFKHQSGERGYQTLINATLREAMQRRTLEDTLRRVIREELHPA
ncbi:BrnA antitoxin family protein [Lamprocystis purpurea]|uniref:BrnA antitoxin family protein n=1 Tax=Lamprocystis purpurea TaxID=61598 RepID=UPI0012FA20C5|nr:BrnA antitoxin family protein [Lamprocystis purpurea]